MPGDKIVVDTNIVIDIIRGNRLIAEKMESYGEVYLSPIVLSELYFGAYRSANPNKNLVKIDSVLEKGKLLPIDSETVDAFVTIKVNLYAKGNLIPENDIWIASTAIQHQIPLLTNDRHFKNVERLILN